MMFGKFIDSSTVTGTQIRLDNNQYLRGRNFANTGDINILKITTTNLIEFKSIPYVEGQGRLALYSELDSIQTFVEYLYGQLSGVTDDITTIQGDIVDIQGEIDALQGEIGNYALKNLSNLTATAIPSGINLESVSIDQSATTGFALRTKNQTTSVSGRIIIRTGTSDSAFSSGGISIDTGSVTNAIGAVATSVMSGSINITSGTLTSGTRGSTGSNFLRSGGVAILSSATAYSGNTGTVGVSSGTIQSSFNGAVVTGNSGFASLISGAIISTVAGATAIGNSGNITVSTGGINTFAVGAIVTGNSGSASFASGSVSGTGTSTSNTGAVTVSSGGVFNANSVGNTGNVSIFSGTNNGTGNSGHVFISTGVSNISGNTGDVNISTGIPVSGSRGQIYLTSEFAKLTLFTRLVLEDNTGDQLVRLQLKNGSSEGYGEFFFNRIRSDKSVFIGAMESHVDDNGAPVYFSGTFLLSDTDGQYKTSDVYLQTLTNSGFRDAPNVAVSTGDIYIKTESSFVQGTETDANTGNITLQTGTPSGAGTKGYISLNADYITANSTQLKNLADGTDPQDAATVSQLGSISGSFANTDLSNLVSPTLIPDGVGLNSVSITSFSISTSDSITTDPTGAIDINTGDINNVASSANTGIMGIRSGETNGSGNTGEVQIYSGNNNGTGSSGNIVISAGTTADDDKTTGSIEIRSGYPFGNSNSGSINIFSHNAQKRTGDVSLHSGNSTSVGDSGNIFIYSGNVTSGIRGSIDLNGQSTSVYLRNFDVTGYHSLFRISNNSPGSIGEMQFLTYARGNDTLGLRIFDSNSISGFSIDGWGRVNENGGPFNFMSTKASPTVDGTLTGGDFNIVSASTEYVDPSLGINASVNSGNVNISTANGYITGSNTDANTGDINLITGEPQGAGTRGVIVLDGHNIKFNTPNVLDQLVALDDDVSVKTNFHVFSPDLSNYSHIGLADPNNTFAYFGAIDNPFRNSNIGTWSSLGQSGGNVFFHGSIVRGTVDGTFKSTDVYLESRAESGYEETASNLEISSGNITVRSLNGFIKGTGANANSGNITLQTGTSQGTGTRGYISLDGDYVTASSTQIKDVADPTDPQDALTLNYFNNNIPSVVEFDFYPLQAYNTYATIYANGSAGVLDPVTPTNPRAGWYFKNSSGSPEKINWYFFDGTLVSCQLQNFSAFAVVTFDSIASLPFFGFYTFPTGSGDIIPGFAHSRVVYSTPYVPSAVTGTKYLIYFGNDPEVFPYLPRIQLTYNAAASGGDQGPTELVSTCAFSSDSGASANNVQVMVENLGLNLPNFKAYFDLLIFPVFQESQDYYGSFYSSQTQTNPVPDIARAMTFNNTDEANGVSIVSNSRITFATGGLYNIQFSSQFSNANGSKQEVDIWLAKNGVNVPYTNSQEKISGQIDTISSWNFFVRVNAGQYVELYWSSPSTDVSILYTGTKTGPDRPETPSIILTVNKIIS